MTKIAGSGSIGQRHGSADPDPHQNVMDPEHWLEHSFQGIFALCRLPLVGSAVPALCDRVFPDI
jgi:hypothetical protein